MKRYSFQISFGLGVVALIWVAATVARSHLLVLVMTALIGAVYVFGAMELRQYWSSTDAFRKGLANIPPDLQSLSEWLITLPYELQNPIRQRVEGERMGLPGPALTPYLVGMLVMLGMLGTFLGMVVTLNGAVFALEGSSSVAGIRAAFSEPIKGLGLAFGTSVAGVATSAMLGLMSSLARRERVQASQVLDMLLTTSLRGFSLSHQRQETFKALQQQSQALPQMVQHLQSMMAQLERSSQQLNERLLDNQKSFQKDVHSAYTTLAQSVDQSLRSSLGQSMQMASDGIRPMVQATMTQLAEQAHTMNERLLHNTQQQMGELNAQISTTTAHIAQTYTAAIARHEEASTGMANRMGQTLDDFSQTFEQRSQALVNSVNTAYALQQSQQVDADQQRLDTWIASLQSMAASLSDQWYASGSQTIAQQQAICDTLTHTAQEITSFTQNQATLTLAEITRLMATSDELVRARIASEAEWAAQHSERAQELAMVLRTELSALRDTEDKRGQAAVARLAELQTVVTEHLTRLGTALEDPITRLIETASEAPKAAAEVIGQLRQEISVSVARDNALLEERTRILGTLSTLLDAINHASTEQRGVIDSLVVSSQASLANASGQFHEHVAHETGKLGDIAAQVTASAVDVASLGETFGFAVRSFTASNDKLMANLERIEQAIDKSMTRSDEQLAYYVAQAREIVDLSIGSQKDVLEALQHRADTATEGAV
ncbi:hypothetical protein B9Z45_14180 [Limnohabitans sp. 2KL-17]|uniref:DUF802 domain-containing protein n=1 Tax=Limnohabitans sp. 2KL-17 TaxID=1100704 RepID=UPI000D33DD0B|nr:DUF802 domain-containing protein [Limnohabitans sp. 2KL-17]PUE51870.1 hypothetical protein B9Z45_14180 [Limnohabitans sp. 2KL-17]